MLVLLLIRIFYGLLWSIISLSKHPYICNTFMCHLTSVITDIYMSNFKCQTTQQIYGHMGVYGKVLTPISFKMTIKMTNKIIQKRTPPISTYISFLHSCIDFHCLPMQFSVSFIYHFFYSTSL